jgi:SNF2 family DNA or RNA helicase
LKHFITARYKESPLFYHGGSTLNQRKEMVDNFQNNRADKIFILSLKAAGTGLNLTAANHVIHYDLWWNPAVEAQATDRAYRIGQKSNVMVHRFITKNTFEEKINEMIQKKKALAEMTVNTGENWIGNLSNKDLKDLFTLA